MLSGSEFIQPEISSSSGALGSLRSVKSEEQAAAVKSAARPRAIQRLAMVKGVSVSVCCRFSWGASVDSTNAAGERDVVALPLTLVYLVINSVSLYTKLAL